MDRERFENIVARAYNSLPVMFRSRIENVEIIVEDLPTRFDLEKSRIGRDGVLLGLYSGVPLSHRGTWYGTTPTLPDRITLYQGNIESLCKDEQEMEAKIYEVLFHEIGHYFGMSEDEIRKAMGDQ
jgi:predicted Zn-dependent protease with MMP-like domain